jgi:hypothetical protein
MPIARAVPYIKQTATFKTGYDVVYWELGAAVAPYDSLTEVYAEGETFPVWVTNEDKTAWVYGIGSYTAGSPATLSIGELWTKQGYQKWMVVIDPGFVVDEICTVTVGPGPVPPFWGWVGTKVLTVASGAEGTAVESWDDEFKSWPGSDADFADVLHGIEIYHIQVIPPVIPGDATQYTVGTAIGYATFEETTSIYFGYAKSCVTKDGGIPGLGILHDGSTSLDFTVTFAVQMFAGTYP